MDGAGFFVSRLFHFWIQPRISRQFIRRGKAGDVPNLAEDDGAQHRANTGDGGESGIKLGEQFRNSFLQYGCRVLKRLELIQVQQEQRGVSALAVRDTETVPGKLLELIRTNPAIGCKLPPLREKEIKVLTREEIQRFLIQAKAEGMYELFLLELTTGMRRGELLALQWSDLDFKSGRLRISRQVYSVNGKLEINEPKTKAAVRTVILPPAMVELLTEYKPQIFSEWMFPSRVKPDQPIDPGYVRKRLQAILERAGCKRVRFHDLRHTFATMSLENGMDVKILSAIIGHHAEHLHPYH